MEETGEKAETLVDPTANLIVINNAIPAAPPRNSGPRNNNEAQ